METSHTTALLAWDNLHGKFFSCQAVGWTIWANQELHLDLRFFFGGCPSGVLSGFGSTSVPGMGPHRAAPRLRTNGVTTGSAGSTPVTA